MTAAQKLQEMNKIYRSHVEELKTKYDAISMSEMIALISEYKVDYPEIKYLSDVINIQAKKLMIAELK